MTDKLAQIVPKLLPLLRMLGSGVDGEIVNAVHAMRRILKSTGADIYALIERIENATSCEDEIEQAFAKGRAAGRAEMSMATASHGNGVGAGINGHSWREIAQFLHDNAWRMTGFERQFCEGIASQVRYRPPSTKQAGIIHQIFVNRFGGRIA